jgi:ABC-2 type transport system permease protein
MSPRRCAGFFGGTATFGQVGLALLAPVGLTLVLAPVVLRLYRRS